MTIFVTATLLFSFAALGADTVTVECETDSEECESITLVLSLDEENKTAAVLQAKYCYYYAYIPESINYGGTEYTVTSIEGLDRYDNISIVEIPETVTYIAPKAIGYYVEDEGDYYYDEESESWVFVSDIRYYPVENFRIYSYKGSAAQEYAQTNGFKFVTLYRITEKNIVLEKTSYTYTGDYIYPKAYVSVDGERIDLDEDWIDYRNNRNAGTAEVYIDLYDMGIECLRGVDSAKKTFTIKKANATSVTFPKIPTQYYTGDEIELYDYDLTYKDIYLYEGTHYTVKYSSNTMPGTAKATFTFKGNFTGKKTVEFKIKVGNITGLVAEAHGTDYVYLDWDWIAADGYRVYMYNSKTEKYELVKKETYSASYLDNDGKGYSQFKTYKFSVKAYVKTDNGNVYSKVSYVSVKTGLSAVDFSLKPKAKSIGVTWTANSKADGYKIYRYNEKSDKFTCVKTVKDKKTTSWTDKNANNKKEYFYYVIAYKKADGKTYSSNTYDCISSDSPESRMNGATLKSRKSFKIYDAQGKKTKEYRTVKLSDSDIKTIEKFAKKNFTKGMTAAEKVRVTLEWINKNVKYASASKDWNAISGLSYVNAIFNKKMGQCAQYNGALASVMAYLGYDVSMVKGYRGSTTGYKTQHFWTEVKIEGKTYVMETGNYGRNGNWSYYCMTYAECGGYIKNGKNL